MIIQSPPVTTNATYLLTDSRLVEDASDSVFFAIKGERHDGHRYIRELYDKGVREFVVEKAAFQPEMYEQTTPEATFWVVNNSIGELQRMVGKHRQRFSGQVVGVTGSNGKTIVKEWLAELLSDYQNVLKSPRSYNSQIGVPLSVWRLNDSYDSAIFEAGISQKNEMKALADVIRPTIGIFTNIGPAHNEGFNSRKEKIAEKLRLFAKANVLVYCTDYQEIDEEVKILLQAINPGISLIGWTRKNQDIPFAVSTQQNGKFTRLETTYLGHEIAVEIPFIDAASIENAIHCLFAFLVLRKANDQLPNFRKLRPVKMRLEMKLGINDAYLIDDTYNNDLGGLEMALNFMNQHHTKRDKLLILSDIPESGLPENELYAKVKKLIEQKGIHEIIGIGEVLCRNRILPGLYFQTTEDFLANVPYDVLKSRFILIKGARMFEFERIVQRLEQKIHGTVFEINLDSVQHNLNFFRSKLKPATKLMVMVKAYAYGSGSTEIAAFLQYHRVDYLSVAYTDEGIALRKNGITLPIMVLNPQPESFANLLEYHLEPEVYSFRFLENLLLFLQDKKPANPLKIHLKLDTGMHRLGFTETDIPTLIQRLKNEKSVQIASVFSHLAGADEPHLKPFTHEQIQTFGRMSDAIRGAFGTDIMRHICNTAGILKYPEAHFEMVRLGIGIYGVDSTAGESAKSLKIIGQLKTVISQIKELNSGETVGYGRKGVISEPARIATIAIGYADGYDRGFSNGIGEVNVNGVLCPVVGNVCMDMTMIDVTHAPCEEGDVVTVYGEEPTLYDLAARIGTIPYELLTNIGERVKRIFYKE